MDNIIEDVDKNVVWINILYKYVSSMAMAALTLVIFPWIVFYFV